jgi:hypothetical protein
MNYFSENGNNEVHVESNEEPTPPIFYWQQTVSKHEGGGYGVIVMLL